MPALLFPATSAEAFQSAGYPSPPPTRIESATAFTNPGQPVRDTRTSNAASPVTHYAPPVHIQPPTSPGHRVPGPSVYGRAKNGRRNTTQNYSYDARPTVSNLSDQSLTTKATPRTSVPVQTDHARQVVQHSSNQRAPGLQQRIASVLQRRSKTSSSQVDVQEAAFPTLADPASKPSAGYRQQLANAEQNRRSRAADQAKVVSYQSAVSGDTDDDEADAGVVRINSNTHPTDAAADPPFQFEFATEPAGDDVHQVTLQAPVRDRVRHPRVSQNSRPGTRRSRVRGKQVSVLSSAQEDESPDNQLRRDNDFGGFGPDEDSEIEKMPVDEVEDFDPLDDESDSVDDDLEDEFDDDDLDSEIDAELNRLRKNNDLDDDDELDDDEEDTKPPVKSCGQFRHELLGGSIRDIPLDTSPPASSLQSRFGSMSRSWVDRSGNVIGTGAMTDLRRGYVILDSGQKIAYARLSESDWAAVSEYWQLPTVCSVGNRGSVERNWIPQTFTWTATSLCHKPLYFENIQLERYGHSHGPFSQPVHSVAHFFVSLVTLPYQTAMHPANECQYALGFYRPGNCAPWLRDPIPISLDGARRQALVATGLSFIP